MRAVDRHQFPERRARSDAPYLLVPSAVRRSPSGARAAITLGIIGGGQLTKMTAQAAAQLGCEVVILERQADFPAG